MEHPITRIEFYLEHAALQRFEAKRRLSDLKLHMAKVYAQRDMAQIGKRWGEAAIVELQRTPRAKVRAAYEGEDKSA